MPTPSPSTDVKMKEIAPLIVGDAAGPESPSASDRSPSLNSLMPSQRRPVVRRRVLDTLTVSVIRLPISATSTKKSSTSSQTPTRDLAALPRNLGQSCLEVPLLRAQPHPLLPMAKPLEEGLMGLRDRSKRPHASPTARSVRRRLIVSLSCRLKQLHIRNSDQSLLNRTPLKARTVRSIPP
jgi:hypothetical protein